MTTSTETLPEVATLTFYPTETWGLDYYFTTFNKMYVRDILQLDSYPMFPGAYAYKNHPIYKVDVLGVVVRVEQNYRCFTYSVDDGTGVIPCCCWKKNVYGPSDATDEDWDGLPSDLRGVASRITDHITRTQEGYTLGDVINVRGKIKEYRDQREIIASHHSRVEDPMVEVWRMAELPKLYTQNYDRPFRLPYKVAEYMSRVRQDSGVKSQRVMEEAVRKCLKDYFQHCGLGEVTLEGLLKEEAVHNLLSQLLSPGEKKRKQQCVEGALLSLEEEGHVCTRREYGQDAYEVLANASALEKTLLNILCKECSKPKYEEMGCHYRHLVDELRHTYQYRKVKDAGVLACLSKLEDQSDIIRTSKYSYKTYVI